MVVVDGKKIQTMRQAANLTREQLAEKVLTSRPMIVYVEKGIKDPSVKLLKRIADFFQCNVEDFIVNDPQPVWESIEEKIDN